LSIVAGIGCCRDCLADEIVTLVQRAAGEVGQHINALAVPAHRASLPGVINAARRLGLGMKLISVESLAAEQANCMTHSPLVQELTGLGSVAEAAALAAAGAGSRLLLPRIQSERATCAIAIGQGLDS
jgi:cobalt-precorrin 5A hydrolase